MQRISPDLLVQAYAQGVFPMADSRESADVFWVDPQLRGVLPLDGFHLSRSLRRTIRRAPFDISFDRDFDGVIAGCADRDETWINDEIAASYGLLHRSGLAHSIELWDEDGALAGGVYGVSLGAAFFGESMFSRRRDASKIALAYLVDRLQSCGYRLFDTQFITPHLASLGGVEISRAEYRKRLAAALSERAQFRADLPIPTPDQLVQRMTQTS
ncbi:leucyl/phenylalanyl-tRNA--protein transferase [Palleronia salina]|uniref:Leucyl/phenylalanyl-tRNA--protein transferase n=2 Tax=Palleronia TaxID=315422 RepID=A0A1M6IVL3_9RHOB|nr:MULTISPECIES: leucyl/phenylalanyl-tRNA--protein transferase [Palleronia]SEN86321.1 leucyl/phenylalanyl-tRNA--protein transferase [Palleronia pelagia]SHJ38510.1 leucyl/phenylalanyl-tRNA--protein transferase [Palleronia salina]